ncbi:zinc finger protein 510-like [Branchiostoma floridae]|uniref:Zinc finger protein 510-like n=1 Tax=Branchiostoma floridae TaxID=7739 RepID=A0A9J7MF60_BRAFL|nr:zinc finger protein 510-like [Branchiostoma floridae]
MADSGELGGTEGAEVHPDPSDSAPKPKYACSICEKTYKTKKGLCLHVQGYHNNNYPFRCEVCGTGVFTRMRLREHSAKHLKKGLAECKTCKKAPRTAAGLQYHKNLHKTTPTLHQCHLCEKTFHMKKNMIEHMKTHGARFECDACDKIYKSKKALVKHHKAIHTENASKDFVCDICSKAFRRKQYLSQHLVHHSTERKFICELCGKKFKTKQHMQVHQGSRNCKDKDSEEERIWVTNKNTI